MTETLTPSLSRRTRDCVGLRPRNDIPTSDHSIASLPALPRPSLRGPWGRGSLVVFLCSVAHSHGDAVGLRPLSESGFAARGGNAVASGDAPLRIPALAVILV
jgi:hypothetical protein